MFKYEFRKYWICLTLIFIAIICTFLFRITQKQWIYLRKGDKYFKETRYVPAIKNYVKALKKDLDPRFYERKLAQSAKNIGVFDPIIKSYEEEIQKNPKKDVLSEGLFIFYVNTNRYDKAFDVLKKFLINKPKNYYIRLQLARGYVWANKFDKAIKEYEKVLSRKIHDVRLNEFSVKLEFARVLALAKNYPKAIEMYKKLIFEKSRLWQTHIELINVYLSSKDFKNAFLTMKDMPIYEMDQYSQLKFADLAACFKDYELAEKIYKKYLKKHPDSRIAFLRYDNMKEWTSNESDISEVLNNIKYIYTSKNKVLQKQADFYVFFKKYEKAIKIYTHLINTRKDIDPKIFIKISDIYFALYQKDEAILYLKKAYELKPSAEFKRKYALALSYTGQFNKSMDFLINLYEKNRSDLIVGLQLVNGYLYEDEPQQAKKVLDDLSKKYPKATSVLIEIANFNASLGHEKLARKQYEELLDTREFKGNIYLNYANIMKNWGDFYKSEKIYENALKNDPDNHFVKIQLPELYIDMKKYERANQIYQILLKEKNRVDKIYLYLAKLRIIQRDFSQALKYASLGFAINYNDESKLLLAQVLIKNKQIDQAINLLDEIEDKKYKKLAILEKGKIYLKTNKELAEMVFKQGCSLYPKSIELYFYCNFSKIGADDFKQNILLQFKTAKDLSAFASLYSSHGLKKDAIEFFENALKIDKDYFPAKFGLAQMLGIDNQISAITKFDSLLKNYPDDYLILLWKARVLSWTKHFKEAIEVYSILEKLNPNDYQIIREKARVAMWDNNVNLANKIYNRAFLKNVDIELYHEIMSKKLYFFDKELQKDIDSLKNSCIYTGYERIFSNLNNYKISEEKKRELNDALLKYLADFQIQKSIFLEKKAKNYLYQLHYIKANEIYEKLVKFMPYNEEAMFDLAQTFCHLNLCNKPASLYKILIDDFSHNRAKLALERNLIKKSPQISAFHEFYEEAGRGDIDRVKRNRTDLKFSVAKNCLYRFGIKAHRWVEKPTYEKNTQIKDVQDLKNRTYNAYGYSIDFDAVFSKEVSSSIEFSQKYYLDNFKTTNLGYLIFNFRKNDLLHVGLGFERKNKIDNIFSLRNDVQVNYLYFKPSLLIKKKFSIDPLARADIYSDKNLLKLFRLDLSFKLTPFPKIFSFEIRGDYRDSNKLNVFVYEGTDLINIIHPYWTPNNYKAFLATLSWYHDLSKFQFCGAEKNYYQFRLSSGTDTEKNPTVTFYGGWFFEFRKKGLISINGYITRSKIWDSSSIWAECRYSF